MGIETGRESGEYKKDILNGLSEISKFLGIGERTLAKIMRNHADFPVTRIVGQYFSTSDVLVEWFSKTIRAEMEKKG